MTERIEKREGVVSGSYGLDEPITHSEGIPPLKALNEPSTGPQDRILDRAEKSKEPAVLTLIPEKAEHPVLAPPENLSLALPVLGDGGNQTVHEEKKSAADLKALPKSNEWLKYPNRMGALYSATIDYVNVLGAARNFDAQAKIKIDTETFNLGMASAELAKSIRESESKKEMLNACKSFASGGIALYQGYSMVKERQKIQDRVDNDPEGTKPQIKQAEERVRAAEKKTPNQVSEEEKKLSATDKADLAEQQKELHAARKQLNDAKAAYRQEYHNELRIWTEQNEVKTRALNSFVEGSFGVLVAMETQVMGQKEKEKAINDTMVQYWNGIRENLTKDKEDAMAQIDRVFQMTEQYSSATQVHLSSGG